MGGQDRHEAETAVVSSTTSDDIEMAYDKFHDHLFTGNDGAALKSGSFIKTQAEDGVNNTAVISKSLHMHRNHFQNMASHISVGQTQSDGDSKREAIVFGSSDSAQLITNPAP